MSKLRDVAHGLYSGEVSYDFVGKRTRWYVISATILLVTVGALGFRGLNLGIEFRGGSEFQIPNATCSVETARDITDGIVPEGTAIVTQLGDGSIRIQTAEVTTDVGNQVAAALGSSCGVPATDIKIQVVGPTWGSEVSAKAMQGLVIFLVLVSIFLAIYFEWRMAVAALVALAHDLIITIGVYALLGFEVTPGTAIGVLTILGYSLYDTVVVFDKVKENTEGILGQSRQTYAEAANLAVNQTLVRSINTSVVALLPVAAILFVGAGVLGAGTLKDLSLALFVGMAAGTYSSILVATPLMVQLKERDPEIQALERRVAARRRKAAQHDGGESDDPGPRLQRVGLDGPPESGSRHQPRRQTRSQRKQ